MPSQYGKLPRGIVEDNKNSILHVIFKKLISREKVSTIPLALDIFFQDGVYNMKWSRHEVRYYKGDQRYFLEISINEGFSTEKKLKKGQRFLF